MPPYVVVLYRDASTTYGGQKSKFGFLAVFRHENDVGIEDRIPVGYEAKFRFLLLLGRLCT